MISRFKKSTVIALGAAAAAVGVASHANAQAADGTVTYVMSINDNGFGQQTIGSFAIYAIDGTVSGSVGGGWTVTPNSIAVNNNNVDGGIDNFNLIVNNAIHGTLNDDIFNGSTYASENSPFTGYGYGQLTEPGFYTLKANTTHTAGISAGFFAPNLHSDNGSTEVASGQDTAGAAPPTLANVLTGPNKTNLSLVIFGVGQSAGDISVFANVTNGAYPGSPTGTTQVGGVGASSVPFAGPGTVAFGANTYLTGTLVADGQYVVGGPTPTLDLGNSTTGLLAAYDEQMSGGGYTGAGSSTVLVEIDQTLGVPEPASVGLFGLGAMGLLSRRRRKQLYPGAK
jgi:hypothetical protein